jgi:hypothetical protein
MVAQQHQRTEARLLAVARNHKMQVRYHRSKAREAMEELRLFRERLARIGIGFKKAPKT